jgi:hypothetical protein
MSSDSVLRKDPGSGIYCLYVGIVYPTLYKYYYKRI